MGIQVEFSDGYTSPVKTKYAPDAPVAVKHEKVYRDADDMNVAVNVIYATESEGEYTYSYDAAGENEVPAADLKNLFVKGVVCLLDGAYYAATSYSETDGITFAFPNP